MWTREILGIEVYHVIQWFLVYSVLGWFVESAYMSLCNRKITNRGFVTGPFCPIYGFGALSVYFLLQPFQGDYVKLYFLGAIVATALEFVVAHVMKKFLGEVWWDYHEKPFNYKGILCLESTVAWGFYTVFLFLFLHKFVMRIVNSYSPAFGERVAMFLIFLFLVDFTVNLLRVKNEGFDGAVRRLKETVIERVKGS
ncbi:MAG: putative ABC transporter permease [Blautia sp.]